MIRILSATALLALVAAPAAAASQAANVPTAAAAASDATTQMDHVSVEAVGAGPPLVLIPGLGTPREVYRPFVAELARTHRVLLVQVNGFGGDAPGANAQGNVITGAVADIAAYLERNRLGAAHVAGHSMGGLVGMLLARDHPGQVRRLLIIDSLPFIGTMFMPGATVEAMRPGAEQMRGAIAAGAMQRSPASAEDPGVANMSMRPDGRLQVSRWAHAANPAAVAHAFYEDATMDLRPDLTRIAAVPTTVLYAAGAPVTERARALFTDGYGAAPSVKLVPIEGSYHFIMLDQPERFRRELAAFLGE